MGKPTEYSNHEEKRFRSDLTSFVGPPHHCLSRGFYMAPLLEKSPKRRRTMPVRSLCFRRVLKAYRRLSFFRLANSFLYNKFGILPQIGADVVMTSRLVSATRSDVV